MTLVEFNKEIKDIIELKEFTYINDDVYNINFKEYNYPIINLYINNIQNTENTTEFDVTLFYIDRLTQNLNNKIQIQSDGSIYLMEIINSATGVTNYPIIITPFTEKFTDMCAGDYTRIKLIYPTSIGTCEEY